jgi:hypothetical protein
MMLAIDSWTDKECVQWLSTRRLVAAVTIAFAHLRPGFGDSQLE